MAEDSSIRAIPKRLTLFEEVEQQIAEMIHQGKWAPGDMLPNEVDLSRDLGVSQGTVRRALKGLVDSGVLLRHQGKGTFVTEFSHNEELVYERYIRLEPDEGNEGRYPTEIQLLHFETEISPLVVSQALKKSFDEPLLHIVRLLSTDQGPVTFDEIWCDAKIFSCITPNNILHHREKMLYAFYQHTCGVTITHCEVTAKAELLDPILCKTYNLPDPLPVIESRRIAFTYKDQPVEYRIQRSITLHYHYRWP